MWATVASFLPREVRGELIVDENFIMKWSRQSLVRQSYQIGFIAGEPHALVELERGDHVGAQVVDV